MWQQAGKIRISGCRQHTDVREVRDRAVRRAVVFGSISCIKFSTAMRRRISSRSLVSLMCLVDRLPALPTISRWLCHPRRRSIYYRQAIMVAVSIDLERPA